MATEMTEKVGIEIHRADEYLKEIFRDRRPEIKQCEFHREPLTLMIKDEKGRDIYEVDLEQCETPAQVLDWIFQIFSKTWSTPKMIYDFLDCLNETCRMELGNSVQGMYCPFGQNGWVNWIKFKTGMWHPKTPPKNE